MCPIKKLPGTRRTQYETPDRPALQPLLAKRYQFREWKKARVHIDYHVEILGHYYGVPHTLGSREVDVRITGARIECICQNRRNPQRLSNLIVRN